MSVSWQIRHSLRDEAETITDKKPQMPKGKDSRSNKL